MQPNAAFRSEDGALIEALNNEIGFGMVFATPPDGPRVAHTPNPWTGVGAVHFHVARGNAMMKHSDPESALVVINGPDGYVSPRWYGDPEQVSTWTDVALELEGRVRRTESERLLGRLETLIARDEARATEGTPWTSAKMPEAKLRAMLPSIVGFELEVQAWRPTFKLSQNKACEERARVADGLERQGSVGMAALMRTLAL
jgi:transcriptional regulator